MLSRDNFAAAYEKHYQEILRFLLSRTQDEAVAQDLAGETFYKAWRSRASFRYQATPRAWLFRIARNTLTDYWRKKKEVPLSAEEVDRVVSSAPLPPMTAQRQSDTLLLMAALDHLPGRMKSIVLLRFIEGLSAREVARRLKITEGNVRVTQYRALLKLREILHHEDQAG